MPIELKSLWLSHALDNIPLLFDNGICRTGMVRLRYLSFLPEDDD
jgi:hypothetical protein